MKKGEMKTYSLEEITDKHIGKRGTPKREAFENELRLDLLGEAIKKARKERNLTQGRAWKACWCTESSNFKA
jgi:HTH-type transcriptional regulator / antitoxin HipB